jgi:hypothetical protein
MSVDNTNPDMIKKKFLSGEIKCYFCNDKIHNFEEEKLFDGRVVTACYECYKTVELGKRYYCAKLKKEKEKRRKEAAAAA